MAISFHSRQTPFSHSTGAASFPKSLRGRFLGAEVALVAAQRLAVAPVLVS